MKRIAQLLLIMVAGYAHQAYGQLTGPSSVYTGINNTYSYTGFVVLPTWQVSANATIVSTSTTGSTYQAIIRFNSGTSGTVTFKDKTITLGTISTTVTCVGLPSSITVTREEPGTINLNPGVGANGTSNKWYSAATGGTLLYTGQTYAPNITNSTTYYVTSYNATCESTPRRPVTATVVPKPVIGSTVPNLNMGLTAILSASNNTYTTYSWKRNGNVIGTSPTVQVTQPGTYTVTVTKTGMTGSGTSAAFVLKRTLDDQPAKNVTIVNRILKDGFTNEAGLDLLNESERQRSITYVGGLGNTLQTIVSKASPLGKDLIQPQQYDIHGRQLKGYLPYVSPGDDGRFRPLALDNTGYENSEQYSFYQQAGNKRATDIKPYTVAETEPSPLGRLKAQTGVGDAWHTAGKKAEQHYLLNRATDNVRLWIVNASGMPESNAAYADYMLYVAHVTDEDGNATKIYTDKQGRTVQKDVEKASDEWLKTAYLYNQFGQLVYSLTPEGVSNLSGYTPAQAFLDQWAFQYRYDNLGRLVEYRAPGSGWLYTVYDILNRPVMTQDAQLRDKNSWAFTKYDGNGRAVVTGIKVIAGSSRASVQSSVNSQTHQFELSANNAMGYTLNRTYPSASDSEVWSIAYFDHYNFLSYTGWDAENNNFSLVPELAHTASSLRVAGLATGSKVRMIGTNTWLNSIQYYDARYRPIQTLSENHLGGVDRKTIKYNSLRQVSETLLTHEGSETVVVLQKYNYDPAGRVTHIYQNINSAPTDQLVARYEYNELGQLIDKKLHQTSVSTFLQSVDLRYTIRGQLQSINNSQRISDHSNDDTDSDRDDYFGMELLYHQAEAGLGHTSRYNGTIAAIKWKDPGAEAGTTEQKSYAYQYDRAARLVDAAYQVKSTTGWNKEPDAQNETMTYDRNGNIQSIMRNQRQYQPAGYQSETVDNLTYTYTTGQGNQLAKVEDTTGKSEGFSNGSNTSNEYTYNTNGSLTADANKGIIRITYSVLGKPDTVVFTDGRKIEYVYSASGIKLNMKSYQGATLLHTTEYAGGFVYENDTLRYFGSPEGRVVKNTSGFEYQYAIADHQGNTRIVFSSVAPATDTPTADFESNSGKFMHETTNLSTLAEMNHSAAGSKSQLLHGGYASQVGAAKTLHVYPGDTVTAEVYAKYRNGTSTPGNILGFATALTAVFGVNSLSIGEALNAYTGLNDFGSMIAAGDRDDDDTDPKGFITIMLFDKHHNLLDAAWDQLDEAYEQTSTPPAKDPFDHLMKQMIVREEGYAYIFVSNENPTKVDIHFDDFTVTHKKTNVIQYNEYYPFGLQTSNSWTRDGNKNAYLYNAGSELNDNTNWYEMYYRGYDPALGRMQQIDPYAAFFASHTPYNYAGNNPITMNDPSGGYMLPNYSNESAGTTYFQRNWYTVAYGQWERHTGSYSGQENIGGSGSTSMSFTQFIHSALNSEYGGSWSNDNGYLFGRDLAQFVEQMLMRIGYEVNEAISMVTEDEKLKYGVTLDYAPGTRLTPIRTEIALLLAEYRNRKDMKTESGLGINLSIGGGALMQGLEFSIGGWGMPASRGQVYFSWGIPKNPVYFDASIAAQFLFIQSRAGERLDLSGKGSSIGVGAGPLSASYGQSLNSEGQTTADIFGIGPSIGVKYSGGMVQNKTWTIETFSTFWLITLLPRF